MSANLLVETPSAELSYAKLVHEVSAIVRDAEGVGFNGLTNGPPPAAQSTFKRILHHNSTSDGPLDLKPIIPPKAMKAASLRVRFDRIRRGFSESPLDDKERERFVELRNKMITRVSEVDKPKKKDKPSIWAQKMLDAASSSARAQLGWTLSDPAHAQLKERVGKDKFLREDTRKALIGRAKALGKYCYSYVASKTFQECRAIRESATKALKEWERMLWLSAEAQLWNDDAQDALIAARITNGYAQIEWCSMVFRLGSDLGMELPATETRLDGLLKRLRGLGRSIDEWPENENAVLVYDGKDENKLPEQMSDALEKEDWSHLIKLYDALEHAVERLMRDAPTFEHTLTPRDRLALREKLDAIRKQQKEHSESDGRYVQMYSKSNLAYLTKAIAHLEEVTVDWHRTLFEFEHTLNLNRQTFVHPDEHEPSTETGVNSIVAGPSTLPAEDAPPAYELHNFHISEKSLGAGRTGAVVAAISQRTARRYNI